VERVVLVVIMCKLFKSSCGLCRGCNRQWGNVDTDNASIERWEDMTGRARRMRVEMV
jgi:hypothetical protein